MLGFAYRAMRAAARGSTCSGILLSCPGYNLAVFASAQSMSQHIQSVASVLKAVDQQQHILPRPAHPAAQLRSLAVPTPAAVDNMYDDAVDDAGGCAEPS